MKILAITNLYPNPVQPHIAPWNRAQIAALAARHDVRVIAPVLWTAEWSAWRSRSARIASDRRSVCDGISVDHPRYYYPPKVFRFSYESCFRISVAATFRRAIQSSRPDVIYATWAYPDGTAACRLGAAAKVPVVVRCHGSDILSLKEYPQRQRRTIESLQQCDAVVTVSRDLSNNVVRMGVPADNVHVVYNGLDTNVFRPGSRESARRKLGIPQSQRVILYVGNLVEVKQVDILLAACRQLFLAGNDFHCHVLGDGPLRNDLMELSRQLGLTESVTFHGQQPQQHLVDWYRSANVVALPSRSEGVPNVLLEASACGIPFVASRVGGIPEIGARHDQLVPAGDASALSAAIAPYLKADHCSWGRLPDMCRSWEESSIQLEEVFAIATDRFRQRTRDFVSIPMDGMEHAS